MIEENPEGEQKNIEAAGKIFIVDRMCFVKKYVLAGSYNISRVYWVSA